MAVFRVNKNNNYTTVSNHHLRDKNLSLKAKGLLTLMLSLPDDWDYSISGLVSICKEQEGAVKSALDELKKNGYLVVTKLNSNESGTGYFGYVYDIFEYPEGRNPPLDNPALEVPAVENHGQLNTKEQSTKELNTKDKEKRFKPPTVEEVREYLDSKAYTDIDPEAFVYHYEANGWFRGKTKMKSWKAAVETWHRRNKPTQSDHAKRNIEAVQSLLSGGKDER